jgi:hypothetical protein
MRLIAAPPDHAHDAPWRASCAIASAVCLGIAIHIRDGLVHPGAILWLSLSLLTAAAAFVRPPATSLLLRHAPRILPALLTTSLAVQFTLLLTSQIPGGARDAHIIWPYYLLLTLAPGATLALVLKPHRTRLFFPTILVLFALLGLWLLRTSGTPRIDVWTSQSAGLEALSHGRDPWSSTFPDVYHNPDLYAPGTVRDGIVHLGFPYPPLTLLFDLPAHLLFGDFRYANLLAMLAAAALIAGARPGPTSALLATLFLFTPRAFLVLRNGWTEPQLAMLLAATVFCACRCLRAMPWLLGLLLVSKQYMILAAAPALLLLPRPWTLRQTTSFAAKAILAAALVTLPLALWNWPAFLHSNFLVAGGAKFRLDALSYFAYAASVFNWAPAQSLGGISFLAALAAAAVALRRADRSPAGFAAAIALMYLAFFCLNKFAFCNYYYFVISALCTSAAATAGGSPAQTAESDNPATARPLKQAA